MSCNQTQCITYPISATGLQLTGGAISEMQMHSAMADKDTPKPRMKRPTICKEFKTFNLNSTQKKLHVAVKLFEDNRFQSIENQNENLI